MKEKYLPIGTVVLLKDATKYLMINGYCSSTVEEPDVFYDYVSLLYPEGSLVGENVILFNHEQIHSIIHMGLINEEFQNLNNSIKQSLVSEDVSDVDSKEAKSVEDLDALPPFTPENVGLILQEIYKHGDEYMPIKEPTAFNEEVIKKPVFDLPTLGGNDNDEKEIVEKESNSNDIYELKEKETIEKEIVPEGQPVLQLQPIFEGENDIGSSDDSVPNAGGTIGLMRL